MLQLGIVSLLLSLKCFSVITVELCPKQCDCDMDSGLNKATCVDQNIISIDIGVPKEVQFYSLSNNGISELDNYVFKEAGYTSLVILNLSNNHITWIGLHAFLGLHQLTNLMLSNNRINDFPSDLFSETPKLEHLDLSENNFIRIKNEPFLIHDNLKILSIRNCRMKSIPTRMFTRLPNLRKLDISENYMITMAVDALKPLKRLMRIELKSVYWKCTTQFMAVESWIESRQEVYKKQCRNLPKMSEKIVAIEVNLTQVDVAEVWNISHITNTIPTEKKKIKRTFLEKLNNNVPSHLAFFWGLYLGLAIGMLGTYIWLRGFGQCLKRRRKTFVTSLGDVDRNLLNMQLRVANYNNETPPLLLQTLPVSPTYPPSIPVPPTSQNRSETPPPSYQECTV